MGKARTFSTIIDTLLPKKSIGTKCALHMTPFFGSVSTHTCTQKVPYFLEISLMP